MHTLQGDAKHSRPQTIGAQQVYPTARRETSHLLAQTLFVAKHRHLPRKMQGTKTRSKRRSPNVDEVQADGLRRRVPPKLCDRLSSRQGRLRVRCERWHDAGQAHDEGSRLAVSVAIRAGSG